MSRARYVTGLRAVEQVLATDPSQIRQAFVEYRSQNPRVAEIVRRLGDAGVDVQSANRARLRQMSGEVRHQGVVLEVRRQTQLDEAGLRDLVEARLQADSPPLMLLVLEGVQDPHNLGACLRSADAAGVDAVVVTRHGSASLGPAVSKVAAGAAETVPFASVTGLPRVLDWLKDYGVRRVGTSDRADGTLYDADLAGNVALVMGSEGEGVSKAVTARCDDLVRLPMAGTVASLNLSVATGICLFEAVRQRRAGTSLAAPGPLA